MSDVTIEDCIFNDADLSGVWCWGVRVRHTSFVADLRLGLVIRLDGIVASDVLNEAQHPVDHGEAGIALEYLAIGITQQQRKVPRSVVSDLRDLAEGLADLPANLADFTG